MSVSPRSVSPRSRRRAAAGVAAGLAGLALAVAVAPTPASAYQPSDQLASAIYNVHNDLFQHQRALWQNSFRTADNPDGDGLPGPDGTPDGHGAFLWFTGDAGRGAIYAVQTGANRTEQGAIYGDILESWIAGGFEAAGYPVGNERNANRGDIDRGCRSGERAQTFHRYAADPPVFYSQYRVACWDPANRQVRWYSETAITS